jgi:hypothetical protein
VILSALSQNPVRQTDKNIVFRSTAVWLLEQHACAGCFTHPGWCNKSQIQPDVTNQFTSQAKKAAAHVYWCRSLALQISSDL